MYFKIALVELRTALQERAVGPASLGVVILVASFIDDLKI
jgi:hypothetical protein